MHSRNSLTSRLALRRPVAVLGTAALCLGIMALAPVAQGSAPASSAAQAASAAKPGKPDQPAPAPAPAAGCTLTDPASPNSEFSMCTVVSVNADETPSLGGPSNVSVTVRTEQAVKNAVLELSASKNLSLVSAPGFGNAANGLAGVGAVSSVSRSVSLAAGTQTYNVSVQLAKGDAYGTIQARLNTGDAKTDGYGEKTWVLGETADANGNHPTTVADISNVARPWPSVVGLKKILTPSLPAGMPTSLSAQAPNASCATGGFFFNDENGNTTPAFNVSVRIWDADTSGGDDLLATGFAGSDGRYIVCFESTDFDQGGGQEAYVQFVAGNNAWRIRDTAASNQDWRWATGAFNYGDPGGSHEFGNLQPSNGAEHRALHAEDAVNKTYLWNGGFLDNPGQTRQIVVNWTPTSTDGTYYTTGAKDIHLAAADPDADHTTIHEASHAFMDALYNDDWPPVTNCNPHNIFGNSSTTCAWTEGWAEWVPARVLNDPFYRWPGGASLNLETPTWNDGNPHGDQNEGRIAGTLIDLSDSANEGYWDRFGEAECYGAGCEETLLASLGPRCPTPSTSTSTSTVQGSVTWASSLGPRCSPTRTTTPLSRSATRCSTAGSSRVRR